MESKPTLRELIDACRPDHDDPQRPELAAEFSLLARELGGNASVTAAYERSQQFDRQVRSALDDVQLPAGLTERMLAGCEAALVEPAEKEAHRVSKGVSRRKLIVAGLAVAASLVVVVLGSIINATRPVVPVTVEQLAQLALQWRDQVTPANLTPVKQETLNAFPLDPAVIVSPSREVVLGPNVVAYELVRRNNSKRALLIVQRTNQPYAIFNFPSARARLPSSGTTFLNAWQRHGCVYVLIYSSDDRMDDFVRAVPVT
jgi:hypothetical protein